MTQEISKETRRVEFYTATAARRKPGRRRRATLDEILDFMIAELGSRRLEVYKGKAPEPAFEGHGIRVVANTNCRWYRDLCDQYQKRRGLYTAKCDYCGLWHDKRKRKRSRCGRGRKRQYVMRSKTDTSIVRGLVVRALEELRGGSSRRDRLTPYALMILDHIEKDFERLSAEALGYVRSI